MNKIVKNVSSMEQIIVNASTGIKYLSEVINELPPNTMFNKGKTGCGGTELELKAKRHSIIVVPYIGLINCKCENKDFHLMGVYSGIQDKDIIAYLNNTEIKYKKIMVTYNSIDRVVRCINKYSDFQIGGVPANAERDFFLLIDEYHLLFNQYDFRNDSITNLLKVFPRFDKVTFMTATPIEQEFMLEELKHFPITKVVWEDVPELNVRLVETKSTINTAVRIIKQRIDNKSFGNIHLFVNSVITIAKIIKACGLHPDIVKIICADKPENQQKLGSVHKISKDLKTPKLINFYTATAFEGVDIFDKEGKTFILSDGKLAHTLIDISTLFIQICGRIRDSHYNNEITHIYSKSHRYNGRDMTYEEYKDFTEEQMKEELKFVCYLNNDMDATGDNVKHKDRAIEKVLSGNSGNVYLKVDDNKKVYFDTNRVKVDRMNFKISNCYRNSGNLVKFYNEFGFDVKERLVSDVLKTKPNSRISFKRFFEEYVKLKNSNNELIGNREERMLFIELERPLVKKAFETLGVDEVRRMKYRVSNITKKLAIQGDDSENVMVKKILAGKLAFNKSYKVSQVVAILQNAYDILGLKRKAKSTSLGNWYVIKSHSKRFESEVNRTITILGYKYILD